MLPAARAGDHHLREQQAEPGYHANTATPPKVNGCQATGGSGGVAGTGVVNGF